MGGERTDRSKQPAAADDVAWAFDGEGARARWADGAEDAGAAEHGWEPAADVHGIDREDDAVTGSLSDQRLRRWATRAAGAVLALLVLFGLVRAYRGDRTHRLIQRDVQHVVRLEAEAMADGDRELFMSLQDERRRRALRRPDVAARWLRSAGPYAGLYFASEPPEVTNVVVAAKDAADAVRAITATVRIQATDGARVGRFEQVQRFVRSDDAHWLHALAADAPHGESSDLERFVAERIHAAFPAADGPVLRPALESADRAVVRYCAAHGRCGGRARFAFGTADASAVDIAQRVTAPSAPDGWIPADEEARQLLAFSLARAAAHRLDYAFSDANLEAPPQPNLFRQPANRWFSPALLEAWLIEDTDGQATDALIADPTAARLGLTLWHLDARSVTANAVSPRELATAARGFAATLLRHDAEAFERAMDAWTTDADWDGYDRSIPPPVENGIGPDGLRFALDWPVPQAPFIAAPIVVGTWDVNNEYLVSREGGVVSVREAACGGARATARAWSPNRVALAVICQDLNPPRQRQVRPELAIIEHDASDGTWRRSGRSMLATSTLSLYVTSLEWSPDGSSIAWSGLSESPEDPIDEVEVGGVVRVDIEAGTVIPFVAHSPLADTYISRVGTVGSMMRGLRPLWSPDGAHVAFRDNASEGFVLRPLDGGRPRALRGAAMAWSPDSTRIARIVWRSDVAGDAAGGVTGGVAADRAADIAPPGDNVDDDDAGDPVDANDEGPENLSPYDGVAKYVVAVHNAGSLAGVATMPLDRLTDVMARQYPESGFAEVNEVMGVEWSDDGRWLAASFRTAARCGDGSDCVVALAWDPESDALHVVLNAPQTVDGQFGAAWLAGWVPRTHRLALYVGAREGPSRLSPIAGETWPLAGQDGSQRQAWRADGDATIALVLDADSGDVTSVSRSNSPSLATLLPDYSPDGRWHARRDRMWRLIIEPVDGIGGFRESDPATGWRFNRPFSSPYVAWSGRR